MVVVSITGIFGNILTSRGNFAVETGISGGPGKNRKYASCLLLFVVRIISRVLVHIVTKFQRLYQCFRGPVFNNTKICIVGCCLIPVPGIDISIQTGSNCMHLRL